MGKFDLKRYARQGAAVRVGELLAELEQIYKAFPDLRHDTVAGASRPVRLKRRRRMGAAARKAASQRMKRYWAARRKVKSAG